MKETTDQDYSKFRHLTGRVWATRFVPLIISTYDKGEVVMRVAGECTAHTDSRGYSGMFLTMGKCAMMSESKKLGVVTVSSTETEIVVDGERFPKYSWFRQYQLEQGDSAKEDVLTKDDESSISIHKHDPFSMIKSSNHANTRCFFVVDKINQKKVMISHFPTEKNGGRY